MKEEKEPANFGLRKKAVICWALSAGLVLVTVCSIFIYRNPWVTHRMDAEQTTTATLEKIADSRSPYIKIDNMTLEFTGYYRVDGNEQVCAYCYLGNIGEQYILVSLPTQDGGQLAQDASADGSVLTDYTVEGQLVASGDMTDYLAEAEDMSSEEYRAYYSIVDAEIHAYGSDRERIRIYQLMLCVLALGAFAVGWILWSEAAIVSQENKERHLT